MIPVRLKLKNFLPYRGDLPAFSFDGIHLACISGDNGSGKTSIIDAITWALWGKSRLRSKSTSDDDLITQGEYETSVTFDFRAGDSQVYRVERRRTKPKRAGGAGQSALNLFIDSKEGFKTVSGNTIGETEERIKNILHLDYETFINSAYLKQGEADHFTELRPSDRKEVLAKILGLDIYDQLAENAKHKASDAAATKNLLSDSIGLEQQQLERRPELEAALQMAQNELSDSEAALNQKRSTLDGLRNAKQLLESQETTLQQSESTVKDIEADIHARQSDKAEMAKRIIAHQVVLSGRQAIEEGFAQYQNARRLNDEFNQKLGELRRIEKRRDTHEKAITEIRHKLELTRDRWQVALDDLKTKAARVEVTKQSLYELKLEIEKLAAGERQMEIERQTLNTLNIQLATLTAEETGHQRHLAEIAEKSGLLVKAAEAICPVCEAELHEDRLEMVQAKYAADRTATQSRINEIAAAKAEQMAQITALERHLATDTSLKADQAKLTVREARLLQEIDEAENAARRLPEGERQINSLTLEIARAEYAPDEQKLISVLDAEIKALDYDIKAHERANSETKTLEAFEHRYRELTEADKMLASEEIALRKTEYAIASLEERLATRRLEVLKNKTLLDKLPRIDPAELTRTESEVKALAAVMSAASERVGSLKQGLIHLDELKTRLADKASDLKRYAAEESLYKELQQAFGKNGIQAILIENAIPEMESEANRLLARMTDNRMSLKIEPMRATKKGDMIETFDIMIADELGTRDYDLFSGGEAFRINFALRLALSRLLAHRAGAPLRTLIIDEGFGTQDASGIEKLKEAISSIQNQFDCILVITHIEEFKDAFPARIEVFKTADGSSIKVSYN
ncbi:exonuclease SbcC [Dehalogenimonas sp. WBC-2]|nr:exonuclease SbcC [Dehalogenimonas sp. WBC-2]